MKESKPVILIVEDEEAIRHFLRTSLSVNHYQIFEANNGTKALEIFASNRLDLLILDLGLPDIDGVDLVREIRQWSNLPIIILSVRNREEDKIAALDAGADDYLTKPFGVGELLARIRGVLRRLDGFLIDQQFRVGDLRMDLASHSVTVKEKEVLLTPTEFEILKILFQHAGKVLTHHQIIDKVWNSHLGDEERLLRVNISNLRHKIEPDTNRPLYVKTELGVGYRLNDFLGKMSSQHSEDNSK